MTRVPFAVHHLDNGWTVREHRSLIESAFVDVPSNDAAGTLARFTAKFIRRHHKKFLTIHHLMGATEHEEQRALQAALRWCGQPHSFPLQPYWTRHRDSFYPGKYLYEIRLGEPIDEVKAFEKLSRGLCTDDGFDLEFLSIMQQLGVNA